MSEIIDKIKQLLDELEKQDLSENEKVFMRDFSALELPSITQDIVDYLFPLLNPYESTFYIYLFRHSVISEGKQYVRVSIRGMQQGVTKSSRVDKSNEDGQVSFGTITKTLRSLEELGAIRRENEPNQEGSLYKVMLPEEIEQCRIKMKERDKLIIAPVNERKEVDFYNIKENRLKIYERDNWQCKYCKKQLTRFTATLDHVKPIRSRGDHSYDNLVTACLNCNSKKNHQPVGDFLANNNNS